MAIARDLGVSCGERAKISLHQAFSARGLAPSLKRHASGRDAVFDDLRRAAKLHGFRPVECIRYNAAMARGARIEYEARLEARRISWLGASRRMRWLGRARLACFVAGIGWVWWLYARSSLSLGWAVAPLLLFFALIWLHERAARRARCAERGLRFYTRALDRLRLAFAGSGKTGEQYLEAEHPYAGHLDLFGSGSLFELLCNAQTPSGEERLARWLLDPATPAELRARQAAVAELTPRLDLREDLAVLGPEVQHGIDRAHLVHWGRSTVHGVPERTRWIAAGIAVTVVLAGLAWIFTDSGVLPLAAALGVEAVFAMRWRLYVRGILRDADRSVRELELLGELLRRIERERFAAPRLAELQAAMRTDDRLPSAQIARLRRLVELLDARRNQIFAFIAPLLLWTTQLCFAIAEWRRECGPALSVWLESLGEIEALCDLATYAYENPEDPFPEIDEDGPHYEAEALGHPLIPRERCVANDLALGETCRLYVVSGSNMSGKSTFLRTIGTNAVLALAGAPVRAKRMKIRPLAIGASLRAQDSLQEGRSRFYAEIQCLRRVLELTAGPLPVLFLLDEVLGGTNSHDRRIGAEALVRQLLEQGAVGLLTTHDLSLAKIVDELEPGRARNVHFEDHFEAGVMRFDYQLRDGVVEKSNALELMRSVGLRV
jgi:hypothetical protein